MSRGSWTETTLHTEFALGLGDFWNKLCESPWVAFGGLKLPEAACGWALPQVHRRGT